MESVDTPSGPSRGRGRGKSRGGLGKYLRARGRGRGRGRPAEFHKRLLLEDEQEEELDEEEQKELALKYGRRQLGTNADRYAEPEPALGKLAAKPPPGAQQLFELVPTIPLYVPERLGSPPPQYTRYWEDD